MFFVFKEKSLEIILNKEFYRKSPERISKALKDLIANVNEKTESYYNYVMRLAKQRIDAKRKRLQQESTADLADSKLNLDYDNFKSGIDLKGEMTPVVTPIKPLNHNGSEAEIHKKLENIFEGVRSDQENDLKVTHRYELKLTVDNDAASQDDSFQSLEDTQSNHKLAYSDNFESPDNIREVFTEVQKVL